MKTVGYFFGTFNPIHNGHLSMAEELIDSGYVDEICFVPSAHVFHKPTDEYTANFIDRYSMTAYAAQCDKRLRVSAVEFIRDVERTYDVLSILSGEHPDVETVLVIGADNLVGLGEWKNFDKLLAEYRILVVPRNGIDCDGIADSYRSSYAVKGITVCAVGEITISSTEMRKAISEGRDVTGMIPERTLRYISENGLYGCDEAINVF